MAKYHDHYEKVIWSNGATALSAEHMNNLESGVSDLIEYKVEKESGKGLSTNDYTTAEKTKLAGVATGAEVNQNAFSNVTVGSTTISADAKTDTLTLVAGSNVTLTPDATNDKVTIASTDTNTHYTTHLYAGTSSGAANAATTNGNTYLIVTDDSTARDRRKIAGTGAATVTSDASGNITINSTDTNTWRGIQNNLTSTSTTDSLAAYQGKVLNDGKAAKSEAIKNITRSGTTFTATKADGTTFTFTQQDTNTTYSSLAAASGGTAVSLCTTGEKYTWNNKASTAVATTSANGLMSAADKGILNSINSRFPNGKFVTYSATATLTKNQITSVDLTQSQVSSIFGTTDMSKVIILATSMYRVVETVSGNNNKAWSNAYYPNTSTGTTYTIPYVELFVSGYPYLSDRYARIFLYNQNQVATTESVTYKLFAFVSA